VVKALALGASAVILGRAPLYGLASAGKQGVSRCIQIFQNEIDTTMALIGARSINDIDPSLVALPPRYYPEPSREF